MKFQICYMRILGEKRIFFGMGQACGIHLLDPKTKKGLKILIFSPALKQQQQCFFSS